LFKKFEDGITHLIVGSAIEDMHAAGARKREQIRDEAKKYLAAVEEAEDKKAAATVDGAST
jgi:hypothetical protein